MIIRIIIITTIFLVAATPLRTFADSADKIPAEITINLIQKLKGAVYFPHKKHYSDLEIECQTCHHYSSKKEYETIKACSQCHKIDVENEIPEIGKAPPIKFEPVGKKNIYNNLCKGCHKKTGRGPVKCKECHGVDSNNFP